MGLARGDCSRVGETGRYPAEMLTLLATLLLVLPLDAPFGEATATATAVDNGLRLEVSVEVEGSPVAVLVRGVASGNIELPPVALGDKGDGLWAGIVELPRVENIRMGFESIPVRGPAVVSELHTLTDLGVDRAIFVLDDVPTGLGEETPLVTDEGRRWGWLGLAAGAAALMLIALWAADVFGGRSNQNQDDVNGGSEESEVDSAQDPIVD